MAEEYPLITQEGDVNAGKSSNLRIIASYIENILGKEVKIKKEHIKMEQGRLVGATVYALNIIDVEDLPKFAVIERGGHIKDIIIEYDKIQKPLEDLINKIERIYKRYVDENELRDIKRRKKRIDILRDFFYGIMNKSNFVLYYINLAKILGSTAVSDENLLKHYNWGLSKNPERKIVLVITYIDLFPDLFSFKKEGGFESLENILIKPNNNLLNLKAEYKMILNGLVYPALTRLVKIWEKTMENSNKGNNGRLKKQVMKNIIEKIYDTLCEYKDNLEEIIKNMEQRGVNRILSTDDIKKIVSSIINSEDPQHVLETYKEIIKLLDTLKNKINQTLGVVFKENQYAQFRTPYLTFLENYKILKDIITKIFVLKAFMIDILETTKKEDLKKVMIVPNGVYIEKNIASALDRLIKKILLDGYGQVIGILPVSNNIDINSLNKESLEDYEKITRKSLYKIYEKIGEFLKYGLIGKVELNFSGGLLSKIFGKTIKIDNIEQLKEDLEKIKEFYNKYKDIEERVKNSVGVAVSRSQKEDNKKKSSGKMKKSRRRKKKDIAEDFNATFGDL